MFSRSILMMTAALLLGGGLLLAGCSSKDKAEPKGLVERTFDSVALAVVETLYPDTVEIPQLEVTEPFVPELDVQNDFSDLVVVGRVVYAASDNGLVIYDLSDGTETIIQTPDKINAVAWHGGKVYVGGDDLYELSIDTLIPVDDGLVGAINSLHSYGPTLMVGTTFGLYSKTVLGFFLLLDEMDITSLASGNHGLWVGTGGQGLYWYNGREFKQRYLARDRALFDTVNCLVFNHDHLYMGTPDALYVYDGGRWKTLTMADGLPSNNVRSIDASRWVVHVGTDQGLVTYFENKISPVSRLETQPVEAVRVLGQKVLVGTAGEGLLMKSGPVVKTLVKSQHDTETKVATISPGI
jgi:ligand-binding sensor domain-containing protein